MQKLKHIRRLKEKMKHFTRDQQVRTDERRDVKVKERNKWQSIRFGVGAHDARKNSHANVLANDAKIMRKRKTKEDCKMLQEDLDEICR